MKASAAISAFFAAVLAALFLLDYSGYFRTERPTLATLQDFQGSVRRMPKDALSWDHAWTGTKLAEGDMISSGEFSHASLRFDEGGLVELGPGTTLILGRSFDKIELQLLTGRAVLHATSGFKNLVALKTTERANSWEIHETETLPTPEESRAAFFDSVAAPKVQLQEAAGDPDIGLHLNGNLIDVASAPQPPVLLSPQDGDQFNLDSPSKFVPLRWSQVMGAHYVLYLYPAQEGLSLVRLPLKKAHVEIKNLPAGSYSWWVRAIDDKSELSTVTAHQLFHVKNQHEELKADSNIGRILDPKGAAAAEPRAPASFDYQPIEIFPVKVE